MKNSDVEVKERTTTQAKKKFEALGTKIFDPHRNETKRPSCFAAAAPPSPPPGGNTVYTHFLI